MNYMRRKTQLDVISHFIHICYKEMIKYVIWNRNTISKGDYLYLYYAYIWVIKDVKARRQLRSKTKTLQDIDFYASRKHLCTQAKIKRPLFRFRLILQQKLSLNKFLYLTILYGKWCEIEIFLCKLLNLNKEEL